jgi:hypothetical protein
MNCPQCGAENPPQSAFCNLCFARFGAGQPGAAAPPAGTPRQPANPPYGTPPGARQQPPPADRFGAPPMPGPPPGAIPPGACTPPGPQMPPGAGPYPPMASDAFARPGGYGYGAPPPPVQPVKRIDPTLMWIVRVVVIVVCFAGGWFLTGWILNRPKTFTSAGTGISFTYPGNWKKVDESAFAMGLGITGGAAVKTELTLADGVSDETSNNFLAVASVMSVLDWETAKANWRAAYAGDVSKIAPAGMSITTPTYNDLTVTGKPAFSVKFTMTYQTLKYDCDITIMQEGATYHLLAFVSKPPKGTNTTFQDLLKTVRFNTAAQPSSLLRYREPALRA